MRSVRPSATSPTQERSPAHFVLFYARRRKGHFLLVLSEFLLPGREKGVIGGHFGPEFPMGIQSSKTPSCPRRYRAPVGAELHEGSVLDPEEPQGLVPRIEPEFAADRAAARDPPGKEERFAVVLFDLFDGPAHVLRTPEGYQDHVVLGKDQGIDDPVFSRIHEVDHAPFCRCGLCKSSPVFREPPPGQSRSLRHASARPVRYSRFVLRVLTRTPA